MADQKAAGAACPGEHAVDVVRGPVPKGVVVITAAPSSSVNGMRASLETHEVMARRLARRFCADGIRVLSETESDGFVESTRPVLWRRLRQKSRRRYDECSIDAGNFREVAQLDPPGADDDPQVIPRQRDAFYSEPMLRAHLVPPLVASLVALAGCVPTEPAAVDRDGAQQEDEDAGESSSEDAGVEAGDAGVPSPCDGLTCGGHGRCAVIDQTIPWCICDPGFEETSDGLGCRPSSVCRRPGDCGDGEACSVDTGQCEAAVCGRPPPEAGDASLGQLCGPSGATCYGTGGGVAAPCRPCAADLVCVEIDEHLHAGEPAPVRMCLPACDPCAPTCPVGHGCYALPSGGGACAPVPLPQLDGQCSSLCAPGLSCRVEGAAVGVPAKCVRRCRPDDGATPAFGTNAAASADCLVDEICVLVGQSGTTGDTWVCRPGTLVGDGETCLINVASAEGPACEAPLTCTGAGGATAYGSCE